MKDHLELAALRSLRHLYFNFFVQADSWGADDWAPWVARTMNKFACPMISSAPLSSTPLSVSPSSSSSSTCLSSNLSLTSPSHHLTPPSLSHNILETLRIRLEFGFTESDDLYVNLSRWRSVDDALGFRDDFPCLRAVSIDVVCVDDGTKPYLESLMVEIKAQFPKMTRRGILHVSEGRK